MNRSTITRFTAAVFTAAAVFATGVVFVAIFTGCAAPDSTSKVAPTSKVGIVASFYPLAEFARKTGGDLVTVTTVIPSGAEPHDFEPSPRDIAGINDAAVFIYNGGSLDPWAAKLAPSLPASVISAGMTEKLGITSQDPHIWLDPLTALKEVEAIKEALSAADPANAAAYEANAAAYQKELLALDASFTAGLSSCKRREFFTSHDAFSRLAERYGLTQYSIAGVTPEAEPSARELAKLAEEARAKEIRYIFFETLASPKLAETLSAEIGAQTLVLNPLEGLTADEVQSGMDYVSVMRQNLVNLKTALECR